MFPITGLVVETLTPIVVSHLEQHKNRMSIRGVYYELQEDMLKSLPGPSPSLSMVVCCQMRFNTMAIVETVTILELGLASQTIRKRPQIHSVEMRLQTAEFFK